MKTILHLSVLGAALLVGHGALARPAQNLDSVLNLEDDRAALQVRLDLISGAKKEITAQYYEVADDSLALGGLALLYKKAEQGVKVRIILDNHELNLPEAKFAALLHTYENKANPNFSIKVFNKFSLLDPIDSFNRRMHDKVLTVDAVDSRSEGPDDGLGMMITGGRNVTNGYFERGGRLGNGKLETQYHDLDVVVRGPVAPQQAKRYFNDLWNNDKLSPYRFRNFSYAELRGHYCSSGGEGGGSCPGPGLYQTEYKPAAVKLATALADVEKGFSLKIGGTTHLIKAGKMTADDWFTASVTKVETLLTRFIFDPALDSRGRSVDKTWIGTASLLYEFIWQQAKVNVTIVTPYLVTTPEQMALFKKLLGKGIKITMITNSDVTNDVAAAQAGFERIAPGLIQMGIKIRLFKGPMTLHEKHVLIDMTSDLTTDLASFDVARGFPDIEIKPAAEVLGFYRSIAGHTTFGAAFAGSFNWDYRSQNLNREVGLLMVNPLEASLQPRMSAFADRMVLRMNLLKLRSCEVNENLQPQFGCVIPKPANYSELRRAIDAEKANVQMGWYLRLL